MVFKNMLIYYKNAPTSTPALGYVFMSFKKVVLSF